MNRIILILAAILICSCKTGEGNKKTHLIDGKAPGVYNGMRVYLNKLNNNRPMVIDTAIVMDEKFYFEADQKLDNPELRFLSMDTSKNRFVFILGDQSLDITISQDSLWASTVTGSADNDYLYNFRKTQTAYQKKASQFKSDRGTAYRAKDTQKGDQITKQWMDEEEMHKSTVFKMVEENPNSLVSSIVIGDLLNSKLIDAQKARSLFNLLNEDVKSAPISKSLNQFLMKDELTAIGSKAPPFEGKTPDDKVLKLEDAMGKVTLIDFWASWCGPCRRENPNVVNAYNKYHAKGFNIISVSLDRANAEEKWKKAIKDDKMDWYHISRLQHWNDPIAKMYNVSSIPATFLIDEKGVIIAKNLRGKALHDKLEELL